MPAQPYQNPMNQIDRVQRTNVLPFSASNAAAQNPISTNPLFRRPGWSYVGPAEAPRRGPLPRLANGTGYTAAKASPPGQAPQLPGFVADNDSYPSLNSYQPENIQNFQIPVPRTINVGSNGREMVGTYEPHDITIGQRFFHQARQAANWQVVVFPPNPRNLLQWQQAQKYRIQTLTMSARPLDSSQYFLGYQVNPQIASQIGQNSLGYMGSF